MLVTPDDAEALAWGIREAVGAGPLSPARRQDAGTMFTVAQSVDALLSVLTRPLPIPPGVIVRELEELIAAPSAAAPRAHGPDTLSLDTSARAAQRASLGSRGAART